MNFINMIRMRPRQKSLFEVLKFLLGVSLGFTIWMIFDLPSLEDSCPKCTVCEESRELQISDLHFQLREPFKPVSVDDVLQFDYFNMSTTVRCSDDEPLEGLARNQKANIKDLVRQMLPLFNSAKGDQVWKMQKLINGYKRLDPLRGEEYIVDAIFASEKDESVSERHLLELVKPFGVVHLVKNELLDDEKMIHFILPISGAGPEFHQFLKNFEYMCLKNEKPVYLLVLLFSEENVDIGSEYEKVKLAVSELTQNYRKAHIQIIHTKRIFSSALALDLGSKQLPPSMLMFFFNPYLTFTRDVLGRCRTNTIEHQLIYYPIVFGQYRPNTVKLYSDDSVEDNSFASISRHTGRWLTNTYEIVCLYNSDYRHVGGLSLSMNNGWDRDFYSRQAKTGIHVFRARDPGLVQLYSNSTCPTEWNTEDWSDCMDHQLNRLGSRRQLARMVLKLIH